MKYTLLLVAFLFINKVLAQVSIQKQLQNQFIQAKEGDTIWIAAGMHLLDGSLWLDGKKNVVISGRGQGQTILDFSQQKTGAEGIKITSSTNITIQDMTVQNAKGDCIKTQYINGITFRNLTAQWTGKPKASNGAYALYPVQCEQVLIEKCTARGASDAGIYVGQSKKIVVRNCVAKENVAGIEIENSLDAEVYDNEAFNNTGGILVFDLPDLMLKKGGNVKVYRNQVHDNNFPNFAPKGNIVAKVPNGTGIMVLATSQVEIYDNKIINNKSVGIGIVSYFITEETIKDSLYYPYPSDIKIHHNYLERKAVRATGKGRLGLVFRYKLKFGKQVPHIIYDGIFDTKLLQTTTDAAQQNVHKLCIYENTNQSFVNIQAGNDFKHLIKTVPTQQCP